MNQYNQKYITKYEKARIIGVRALQISAGSPLFIDVKEAYGETNPQRLALLELRLGKIPMVISRLMPNGEHLNVPVNQLIIR